jgi:hypothetical protein
MCGYPRPQSRPRALVALAVVVIAAIAVYMLYPRLIPRGKVIVDQSYTVKLGSFLNVSAPAQSGKVMQVTVTVNTGGPVDILLLSSDDKQIWDRFTQGTSQNPTYISQGSALNVRLLHYSFISPKNDTYQVLINNAGKILNGAYPTGDISVSIKVVVE